MRLSALAIRTAKPRETPYKLGGGGLYPLKPNGTWLWRMNFAYMGRQKTLSFGEWHLTSLAEAREKREGPSSPTLGKIRWLLDKAYATLDNRPITKIGAQEVLMVLRRIEAAKHYGSAKRMRSIISRVFRYTIATARADRDVAVDLRGALATPKVKHHAAITDPAEASGLMRAIAGYTGHDLPH